MLEGLEGWQGGAVSLLLPRGSITCDLETHLVIAGCGGGAHASSRRSVGVMNLLKMEVELPSFRRGLLGTRF